VAWLAQLNHVRGADGIDQRLEVPDVLVRRVDRADRDGMPDDPFLKLVGRCWENVGGTAKPNRPPGVARPVSIMVYSLSFLSFSDVSGALFVARGGVACHIAFDKNKASQVG
jgi:hypothetical protein